MINQDFWKLGWVAFRGGVWGVVPPTAPPDRLEVASLEDRVLPDLGISLRIDAQNVERGFLSLDAEIGAVDEIGRGNADAWGPASEIEEFLLEPAAAPGHDLHIRLPTQDRVQLLLVDPCSGDRLDDGHGGRHGGRHAQHGQGGPDQARGQLMVQEGPERGHGRPQCE